MTNHPLTLSGLAADNLLAYLAALGTLRTASLACPAGGMRLNWENIDGRWRPRLQGDVTSDREAFVALLDQQLRTGAELPALNLADDLTLPVEDFHAALQQAQQGATHQDRRNADFFAAFGSEVIQSRQNGKPTGKIADTALRTMSGAGHQHFLGTMRTFIADTTAEHLHKALFEEWNYDDPLEKHSLRWDPADDIRYALRWDNPSGDRNRKTSGSMWGANRLAIEALPLFPVQPVGDRLVTTGFSEGARRPTELSWPVWSTPIGLAELRSLLTLPSLQAGAPDHAQLAPRGIVAVYRCQRITQGKFRNFTPAIPV